jgi:hypothetical protein
MSAIDLPKSGNGVDGFGLGLILAMEVPNLYSAPLPSKFTIATFSDPEHAVHTRRWIRSGEIEGTLQGILLGAGGSILTRSAWPFFLVLVMLAWKIWSYEDALRRGGATGPGINMAAQ